LGRIFGARCCNLHSIAGLVSPTAATTSMAPGKAGIASVSNGAGCSTTRLVGGALDMMVSFFGGRAFL